MNKFESIVAGCLSLLLIPAGLLFFFPHNLIIWIWVISLVIFLLALPLYKNKEELRFNGLADVSIGGEYLETELGSIRYEYIKNGNFPLIVFVNGFPSPLEIWDNNMNEMHQHSYNTLRFDLFGLGYSQPVKNQLDVDFYCRQIHELLESLDIHEPINIVGFSMGCSIVAAYTNLYPDKVRRIVFISPISFPINISPFHINIISQYLTIVFVGDAMKNIFANNFNNLERADNYKPYFMNQLLIKGFRRSWISIYRNIFTAKHIETYRSLASKKKNVLLIASVDDKIFPVRSYEVVRQILSAELVLVENAGHSVQYESPKIINESICRFLEY